MICAALLDAFGKRTTNTTLKLFGAVSLKNNGLEHMFDDVITYVGELAKVSHDLGDLESEDLQQVIEVLNKGLARMTPALAAPMKAASENKHITVEQWCEIMVDKATQRLATSDDFADWEKDKSKGTQPLSDAERLRLPVNNLEKENAQLKRENAQLKASEQSNPSTSTSAVGNTWLL